MALSYNLVYQEFISVHPTRRQIFAGKTDNDTMSHIFIKISPYSSCQLNLSLKLVLLLMKYYCTLILSGLHWLCWIWWEKQMKWINRKVKEKKNVLYRAWQAIQDPAGTPWQPCLLFAELALWAAGRLCCSLTLSSKYFILEATIQKQIKVEKMIRIT